jgi:hypothetical protein
MKQAVSLDGRTQWKVTADKKLGEGDLGAMRAMVGSKNGRGVW